MEGKTAREPTLIRGLPKIKILVIGKLANNRSGVLGRCGPTELY